MKAENDKTSGGQQVPIAVIGVGSIMPGSVDVEGFWRNIVSGQDLITDVPPSHWLIEDYYDPDPARLDKTYARRGAFLPTVDFDPMEFGIPPNALPATDTAQLLGLLVAQQAITDAFGSQLSDVDKERASVILGASSLELLNSLNGRLQRPIWLEALRENGIEESRAQEICDRIAARYVVPQEATFPGLLGNVIAGRIANRFDLHGTNHTTDAACASSLAAIYSAVGELSLGRADLVITGGVDAASDIGMFMCFSKTPALSPSGDCRPFSDQADGTMLGEGIAMFALKRLADAERAGDRIYAVIRGIGTSSDGKGTAIYAPVAKGQVRALRRAYGNAGYRPETVELVEAHGTGTKAGDLAETSALREVFGEAERTDQQWCALGSIKSQIGHTKTAAGAAGLLKAVMAVHHKVLPPTIKIARPSPELELENSAFYLNTEARPWIRGADHPRRASVSSFGFGGSNFHLTLEEYIPVKEVKTQPAWRIRTAPTELVLFSADSPNTLIAQITEVDETRELADLSRESQQSFAVTHLARLALTASSIADLREKLSQVSVILHQNPREAFAFPGFHYAFGPAEPGKIGFLFPGQGAQYVGMGADLAMQDQHSQRVWDNLACAEFDNQPLHRLVFPPPTFTAEEHVTQANALTATEWAQPALAVHSLALLEVLGALGLRPDAVAGHSFGELVALQCAGAFSAKDLVRLARRRGEAIRDAATILGAMVAVSASVDEVKERLDHYGESRVWIANHNGPEQVVLSGASEAIEMVAQKLKADGITVVRLSAANAFHSPLVAAATEPLLKFLQGMEIHCPELAVYSNADASTYPLEPDLIRSRIAEHVAIPVLFAEMIESMYADGVRTFVEVGAKTTLSDLTRSILGSRAHLALGLDRKGSNGIASLQEGLAQLAVRGVELKFESLWELYAPVTMAKEREPRMTVKINGANYGKPYPPAGGAAARIAPNNAPTIEYEKEAVPIQSGTQPESRILEQPTAPRVKSTVDDGWIRVVEEAQRQTAEAHSEYQRMMTESHLAFLRMSEVSFAALLGTTPATDFVGHSAFTEHPAEIPQAHSVPQRLPSAGLRAAGSIQAEPAQTGLPQAGSIQAEPVTVMAMAPAVPSPRAEVATMPSPPLGSPPITTPEPESPQSSLALDVVEFEQLLLGIVAERTGYPVEMVKLEMELEADLGIDSIKRVEIFSAVQQHTAQLQIGDIAELSKLRTLREIVDRASGQETSLVQEIPPAQFILPVIAEKPVAEVSDQPTITRLLTQTKEVSFPGTRMPGLMDGPVVVTDEGSGIANFVVAGLEKHGVRATVVERVVAGAQRVIFLGGLAELDSDDARGYETAAELQLEAFRAARTVASAAGQNGLFVTVQDTGGNFGLSGHQRNRAWLGGLAALTRTAAKEWSHASVKAIDCERGDRDVSVVAAALVRELLEGGDTPDVGLAADGTRHTLTAVSKTLSASSNSSIDADSVIVATGGGRGVTAAALIELARTYQPKLVLLGRTPLTAEPAGLLDAANESALISELARRADPGSTPAVISAQARQILAVREIRATLKALSEAGSQVQYLCVDVRDRVALSAALVEVRSGWGPVTGIVHGAGVLADKSMVDKTDEQFRAVVDTKVAGLRSLLAATSDDPLEVLCLFSSIAASFGNAGQSDYAVANEVLNHVASVEHARRPGCLVRSIAWGPWQGGMVTPALAQHFDQQGVALIPLKAGAQAFVAELAGPPEEVRVILAAGDFVPPVGETSKPDISEDGTAGVVERAIDSRSHPYLADHRINGAIVLPMVLALDWFVDSLNQSNTEAKPTVLRDIRALRKILLPNGTTHLTVHKGRNAEGIKLELHADDGVLHYRGHQREGELPGMSTTDWPAPSDLSPQPRPEIYDGQVLFHGPCFQALNSVTGVSASGAVGAVIGVEKLGWLGQNWRIDPAAVDGALQLALLWAERVLDRACLPMAIGECRIYRPGPISEITRCVVRAAQIHQSDVRCDIALIDADGEPRVEMFNVDLVARPR